MAHIVRTENKDWGGVMVWVDEDIYSPIYFADGVYDNKALDEVLVQRQAAEKESIVDGHFAEVAQEAADGVEAKRELKQAELGDAYKDMTRHQVRAYVSVTVNTTVSP